MEGINHRRPWSLREEEPASSSPSLSHTASADGYGGLRPPKFTIDLSQPPEQRYAHLAPHFRAALPGLTALYYEVLGSVGLARAWIDRLAPWLFRRVASAEQTAELRGIARSTGLALPVLVCFNVLLDALMGCTSGGVRVTDDSDDASGSNGDGDGDGESPPRSRMLHFRTLDWGMDALRRIVVELAFVRAAGGPPVATAVTYFGYVGVLTGVRAGLSLSLNFRPTHDRRSRARRARFRAHQLLVVLGWRPGIAAVLRGVLLDAAPSAELARTKARRRPPPRQAVPKPALSATAESFSAVEVAEGLRPLPCTAAYIILCDGRETAVLEKDHRAGAVRRGRDFVVALNHDAADTRGPEGSVAARQQQQRLGGTEGEITGMEDLVAYSVERGDYVQRLWQRDRQRFGEGERREEWRGGGGAGGWATTREKVRRWMADEAILNQETHFGVLMDPTAGEVVWLERYLEPLTWSSSDD